jgi:predicted ester cyclase
MKKLLTMLVPGLMLFVLSCNNKSDTPASTLSPAAQKNLDAMHGVTTCFETKDFSKLGDYIATDAVDHAGETGDIKGLDSMKTEFAKWTAAVDEKGEIIKELADDDYVMSWMHYTGTYKTDGMGHKAGDKLDMKGIELAKFKDGKAVEHWMMMEPADLMKMMGGGQEPKMPMPADSTKKETKKK